MSASRTGEQTEQSVKPFFFLTEDLPFPQNSGAKLRNWSILRILAEKAPVEILTFDDRDLPESDEPWMKRLRVIRLPSARAPVYRRALSQFMPYVVNGFSPAAAEIIRERARSHPDSLVWIAKLSMAKYIRTARNERLAVVLDEHNVESDLWLRSALSTPRHWRDVPLALQCRFHERRFCLQADSLVVTSEQDRERMRELAPGTAPFLLPNLIATDQYSTSEVRPRSAGTALFMGTLDYAPNVEGLQWFCAVVLPELKRLDPVGRLRFKVAGSRPTQGLRELLKFNGIELFENPPSMLPLLQEAEICFVPLRSGGGTRLKILEAMSASCPVVSTRIGAEGLGMVHERELLFADEGKEFARELSRLAAEKDLRSRLAGAALETVQARFDWRTGRSETDRIIAHALNSATQRNHS